METLNALERIGTDNKVGEMKLFKCLHIVAQDVPVEEMKIERVAVFVNPFQEAQDELKEEREAELLKASEELKKIPKPVEKERKVFTSGVGKYINPSVKKEARKAEDVQAGESNSKKKKSNNYSLSDFSAW